MSTAQLLAEAVAVARASGFLVREDHLDGAGGGHCFVQGGRWLLLDVTQSLEEQLDDTLDALRDLPFLDQIAVSPDLQKCLKQGPRLAPSGRPTAITGSTIRHAA